MKQWILAAALVATGGACKKKAPADTSGAQGSSVAGSAAAGSGSAGMAMGSGSAGSGSAEAKPMTAAELGTRFEQCWSYVNDGKWDDFKTCYAPDAIYEMPGSGMPQVTGDAIIENAKAYRVAFPDVKGEVQLELINGHTIIAVSLTTGTNSAPMKMGSQEMPATNKKIGMFTSQVLDVDDTGHVKHEWEFMDEGTLMGQLMPSKDHPVRPVVDKLPMAKEVVIAKDDDAEKANLDTVKKFGDAFNKHDAKALGDLVTDDLVWSEQANPKDWSKKELITGSQGFWKAFSDIKMTASQQWAAGDYVATVGTMEGTNDGDWPAMKLKKTGKHMAVPSLAIFKLEKGKLKHAWIFGNGLAMAQQLGLMPGAGAAAGSAAPADKKPADKKPADKKPADKTAEPTSEPKKG